MHTSKKTKAHPSNREKYVKVCQYCKKKFHPKLYKDENRLQLKNWENRQYCGTKCAYADRGRDGKRNNSFNHSSKNTLLAKTIGDPELKKKLDAWKAKAEADARSVEDWYRGYKKNY